MAVLDRKQIRILRNGQTNIFISDSDEKMLKNLKL